MHLLHHPSLLALLLPATTLGAQIQINIATSSSLPTAQTLPPSTHATLTTTHKTHTAPLTTTNQFLFRNISIGSYLLDIHSATQDFHPLRVDVLIDGMNDDGSLHAGEMVEAWGTFRGNEWENKGEVVNVREERSKRGGESVWELEVRPKGVKEYYMPRNGFSPFAMLKNPMILIAGFSMLIIFGMPYLMDNMDPDLKAEFEKQQAKGSLTGLVGGAAQGQGVAGFDAAAWLAGSGKGEEKGVSR